MTRKTDIPLSVLLLVILLMLVSACDSQTTQKEGGSSSQNKGGQAGSAQGDGELTYIGREPMLVYGTSYVGPLTEIFGDVSIGEKDFVASNTVLRAAPGNKVELGSESNIQDNVTVRALENSVTIGERTSLTHHAFVRDSKVGDFVFVGYGSEIYDSEVGDGSYIYHGAVIDGVKIPEKSFVGPGEVVDDQKTADDLPKTSEVDLSEYYNRKQQLDTNSE